MLSVPLIPSTFIVMVGTSNVLYHNPFTFCIKSYFNLAWTNTRHNAHPCIEAALNSSVYRQRIEKIGYLRRIPALLVPLDEEG